MNNNIRVSVIIPVYNAERFLRDTLDSIRNQTLDNIEIICVDDGSTDSSVEIIKEYQSLDSRIRLLFQKEESKGAALARNMGVRHANGKYLSILDADDLFRKDMLEVLSQRMEETRAEVAICNMYEMRGEKGDLYPVEYDYRSEYLPDKAIFSGKEVHEHLLQIKSGSAWSCMFLREYIQREHIEFRNVRYTDDIEFTFLSLAIAQRIVAVNERLIFYRIDAVGNQSSKRNAYAEIGYLGYLFLKEEFKRRKLYETYKKSFVNKAVRNSIGHLNVITDYNVGSELFLALKDRYMKEFDAFEIDDDDYYDQNILFYRDNIVKAKSFDQYLFLCTRSRQQQNLYSFWIPKPIMDRVNGDIRVVFYGTGDWGKRIYMYIKEKQGINIMAWIDRDCQDDGCDVKQPQSVEGLHYDMVFAAVAGEDERKDIMNYLISIGVEERSIVWMEKR